MTRNPHNLVAVVFLGDKRMAARRARVQAKSGAIGPSKLKKPGTEYNIWYHKTPGKDYRGREAEPATSRCDSKRDSGWTKGERIGCKTVCLHFSRGACSRGADCEFLHRVPTPELAKDCSLTSDIFGRERHRDFKSDMGGVGSFERPGQTLYVGGLPGYSKELEEAVRREFGEWGPLERVYFLRPKGVVFVKYHIRANAEFAKEAMIGQILSLSGGKNKQTGILNIRWAHEDPNPRIVKKEEYRRREVVTQAILEYQRRKIPFVPSSGYPTLPVVGYPPLPQRLPPFPPSGGLQYPDTNGQYPATSGQSPGTPGQYPDASGQFPDSKLQYPDTTGQYPDTTGQYPDTTGLYPDTSGQYPDTSSQYPDTSSQFPDISGQYPGTSDTIRPNSPGCMSKSDESNNQKRDRDEDTSGGTDIKAISSRKRKRTKAKKDKAKSTKKHIDDSITATKGAVTSEETKGGAEGSGSGSRIVLPDAAASISVLGMDGYASDSDSS